MSGSSAIRQHGNHSNNRKTIPPCYAGSFLLIGLLLKGILTAFSENSSILNVICKFKLCQAHVLNQNCYGIGLRTNFSLLTRNAYNNYRHKKKSIFWHLAIISL